MKREIVIIGGGPAGLAAAISARESGVEDVLIISLIQISEHTRPNSIS